MKICGVGLLRLGAAALLCGTDGDALNIVLRS
ncbi:hypothetical protein HDF14_004409 [Edaphobacter lichenicola]|uniref:Uncharacterized protein n=1 Tax=Tunturiibacter gelidiferens TaxID=3069689 RepID=A0A9X0U5T0_9BACT|nr:hypothetical protein [Edaphobacter lichenicola]